MGDDQEGVDQEGYNDIHAALSTFFLATHTHSHTFTHTHTHTLKLYYHYHQAV